MQKPSRHEQRTVAARRSVRVFPVMLVCAGAQASGPALIEVAIPRAFVRALTDAGLLQRTTLAQYAQRVLVRGIAGDISRLNRRGPRSTATGRAAR